MRNKAYFIISLFLLQMSVSAQNTDSARISTLEQQNIVFREQLTKLEQKTQKLAGRVASTSEKVNLLGDVVEQKVGGLHEQMDSIDERYGLRLNSTESAVQEAGTKQKKSVTWGIVVAIAIFMLLVAAYFILRKRIAKKGDDIDLLRARADDLNRQMVERMDKELAELQKIASATSVPTTGGNGADPDHSLVKALADRITFMEMTLYRMDPSVKGHKQLTKSIKNMKDNLLANGYELVDMLGKDYVEGMKLNASFVSDDNIEEGKQIITGIVKPQINYKGKMIQAAQITVSQNI